MADILNRLLLETKDFDAKLSNSKKSVNDYSGSVSDMAKTAGLGIGKLAGALGLAMGAGEAFNKVLNSSQTLGDMTARNMAALKTSVDEFFYSLGSGEFDSFLRGLGDVIDKAKEAHGAIDQLGNTKISHGYFSAENESKIADSQYVAKNKFAPLEDRVKAFENWRKALNSQKEINTTLQSDLVKAIVSSVEAEIGGDKLKVSMNDVRMALKIDVTNPQKRDELKSQYSADYKEYRKAASKLDSAYQKFDKNGNVTDDRRGAYRAMTREEKANEFSKLNEKYREAIVVNAMLNKYEDDELTLIAGMAIEYKKLNSSLASISREYNETAMEFNNSNKAVKGFSAVASLEGYRVYSGQTSTGGGGSLKASPPPIGSIAAIDAELTAKNKELISATTAQARIAVQTTINELEARKVNLQIEVEKGVFKAEHGDNKLGNALLSEMAGVINSDTKNKDRKVTTKGAKGFDFKNVKKIKSPVSKSDIKLLGNYQEGLYGIGDAMGFLAGRTNEEAASWLNWGASVLNAVGQAIPAIEKLIPALTAKAGAEAIAQTSSAGPLGWIMAGVAVASILASFASLPKFANGGIIEGGSTFGDMNLARVNSGEMILNRGQQSRLFNVINSGEIARNTEIVNTIASTSIRGTDLILVINNELKSRGKKTL